MGSLQLNNNNLNNVNVFNFWQLLATKLVMVLRWGSSCSCISTDSYHLNWEKKLFQKSAAVKSTTKIFYSNSKLKRLELAASFCMLGICLTLGSPRLYQLANLLNENTVIFSKFKPPSLHSLLKEKLFTFNCIL